MTSLLHPQLCLPTTTPAPTGVQLAPAHSFQDPWPVSMHNYLSCRETEQLLLVGRLTAQHGVKAPQAIGQVQ